MTHPDDRSTPRYDALLEASKAKPLDFRPIAVWEALNAAERELAEARAERETLYVSLGIAEKRETASAEYAGALAKAIEGVATYLEANADPANPDDTDNWVLMPARVLRAALAKNPTINDQQTAPKGQAREMEESGSHAPAGHPHDVHEIGVCQACKGSGEMTVQERVSGTADECEERTVDCSRCGGTGEPRIVNGVGATSGAVQAVRAQQNREPWPDHIEAAWFKWTGTPGFARLLTDTPIKDRPKAMLFAQAAFNGAFDSAPAPPEAVAAGPSQECKVSGCAYTGQCARAGRCLKFGPVEGWRCPACMKPWAADGEHTNCPPPQMALDPCTTPDDARDALRYRRFRAMAEYGHFIIQHYPGDGEDCVPMDGYRHEVDAAIDDPVVARKADAYIKVLANVAPQVGLSRENGNG